MNTTFKPGNLTTLQCKPRTTALQQEQITSLLQQLSQWSQLGQAIHKQFAFKDFYQTMSFVNAVAWISNQQDHHPELCVGYNTCKVEYSTHSVSGLTENDFICAAKVDALLPA